MNGSHIYSPSDESEGTALREFVDETLAQQEQTRSPRSELLSSNTTNHNDRVTRRGPSTRYRRDREIAYRNTSPDDLLRLLIEHEYESAKMRKTLYMVFTQLEVEQQHAAEAERSVESTVHQFKLLNDKRLAAEREVQALEEQLTLWKVQYNLAQTELTKARQMMAELESQRNDAENVAERAKGDARKVREAMGIWKAREEGRRQGFEDGWKRAREEFNLANGRPLPALTYDTGFDHVPSILERPFEEQGPASSEHESDGQPPPSLSRPPPRDDVVPHMPAPPSHNPSAAPRPPSAPPQPILQPSPQSHPQIPFPMPNPPSRPPSSRAARTPAIQMYTLDIPPADADEVQFHNQPPARSNSWRRPKPASQEPPFQRHRSPSPRPPDNYIPVTTGETGHIVLPPPHELVDYASPQVLPTNLPGQSGSVGSRAPSRGSHRGRSMDSRPIGSQIQGQGDPGPSSSSWYLRSKTGPNQSSTSLAKRSIILDTPPQSEAKNLDSSRRSIDSRHSEDSSTNMSHMDILQDPSVSNTSLSSKKRSLLGRMFGGGKGKEREHVLSVIKENPLSRQGSMRTQGYPSPLHEPSRSPTRPLSSQGGPGGNYPSPSQVKQRLGYADPGPSSGRSVPYPMRHVRVPTQLKFPSPLSPPQQGLGQGLPGHGQQGHARSISMGSMGSAMSGPGGMGMGTDRGRRTSVGGGSRADSRLSGANEEEDDDVVGVRVEPPSGSASLASAPSPHMRPRSASGQGPTQSGGGIYYPYGNPPRHSQSRQSFQYGDDQGLIPTVPNSPAGSTSHQALPNRWPSERPTSRASNATRASHRQSTTPGPGPGSVRPGASPRHRYSNIEEEPSSPRPGAGFAGVGAGNQQGVDGGGDSGLRRVPSRLSVRSGGAYDHFDPSGYVDPAFYGQAT
ncbi:hypothetical protein VKT23_019055 [Stygiomarasmius scandens]|uniref:Uncharacterized protein n=1 Tax=Marasmiellus scandens TaxID=2682957 RepID=A0ABR1IPV1_9AGAR